MKKELTWMLVFVLLFGSASAVELQILDKNLHEEMIFSPSEPIIFKAYASQNADSAMLILTYDANPIETIRMQLLSDFPRQFAYLHENQLEQGDYTAKVLSRGESTELEFYVGHKLEGELMTREEAMAPDFFEQLWNWIKSLFAKNE